MTTESKPEKIAAAEAAVASAQAACAAAAQESRLAIAAKNESHMALAEAQLALAKLKDDTATKRAQESLLQVRRADDILEATRLKFEELIDPFGFAMFPRFLAPFALDPLSVLGGVQLSADGRTITGAMDYGNILGLEQLQGYAQFFEWRATGDVSVGLTSVHGATSPSNAQGSIMWNSNGTVSNFLGTSREDGQIEGFLGDGVRGGMLVNINEGRLSFHVRPHAGVWTRVFETPLPRAAYRLKYCVNPGGSIEVLGVRRNRSEARSERSIEAKHDA